MSVEVLDAVGEVVVGAAGEVDVCAVGEVVVGAVGGVVVVGGIAVGAEGGVDVGDEGVDGEVVGELGVDEVGVLVFWVGRSPKSSWVGSLEVGSMR